MAKLGKQERIKRLKKHLATLKAGGSVSKRDMKSILTDEQMQQYDGQWESVQNYKQWIIDGRSELESYTKKLKVADAIWTRYENTSAANRKAATEYAAQSAYESALEHLDELMSGNPAIHIYLDRKVSFVAGNEPSLSVHDVPRYKLSKSHYADTEEFETKDEIKFAVIEAAINEPLQNKTQQKRITKSSATAQVIEKLRKLGLRA